MPNTQVFALNKSIAGFAIERFDRCDGMRVPVLTLAGVLDADFHLSMMAKAIEANRLRM